MTARRSKRRPRPGEVRAVAVDVDGTLADESRRVSLEAVAALRSVEDSGIPVMLASGNVLPIAYALSNYLGFCGPIVAENGGIGYYRGETWILGKPQKPLNAYKYLRTKMDAERLFTDKWRETEVGLKRDVDLEKVRRILKGRDVDVQTTGFAVHIMQKGMNKFLGVSKACKVLGIPVRSVAAIGDSDNDEMMIRRCGFGIAVGNAFEESKEAASYVAEGEDGAGVVEGLQWLGLIGHCSGKVLCRQASLRRTQ